MSESLYISVISENGDPKTMPEKCDMCGNTVKNYKSYTLINLHHPIKRFCCRECKLKWIFEKSKVPATS